MLLGGPSSPPRVPGPHQERRSLKNRRNKTDANGEERTVVNRRPKYLPNLKNLQLPRTICEHSDRFVLIPLSLQVHQHDAAAAVEFQDEKCVCFDLPRSMFPMHAPLGKITYLPRQLLPSGFDAGGVFAGGVLSRKFYPIGLMAMQQKGQTPPLFVGRRSSIVAEPRRRQPVSNVAAALQPPVRFAHTGTSNPTQTTDLNKRLVRNEIAVAQIVHQPSSLAAVAEYLKRQCPTQTNIYVPDMSQVVLVTARPCRLAIVILSTVLHPHVPMVAFATLGDDGEANCPRFELPREVFPAGDGFRRPVFLPPQYLPRGFDAGCVYSPGSLPDGLFQGPLKLGNPQPQHNVAMTPPLFVGRCKRGVSLIPDHQQMLMQLQELSCQVSLGGTVASEDSASSSSAAAAAAAAAAALVPALSSLTIAMPTPPASVGVAGDCHELIDMDIEESDDDEEEEEEEEVPRCSHCPRVPPTPPPCTLEFVERLAPENWRNDLVAAPPVKTFDVDADIDAIGDVLEEMRTRGVDLVLKGDLGHGFNYDRACEQFRDMIERRDEIREQMSVSVREHEEKMQRFKKRALRRLKKSGGLADDPNATRTICATCGELH